MTANKFCAAFVAFFLAGIASISTCVADDFQGTWKVKDSSGRPFDITLLADGKATSTMHPDQTGSWKEQELDCGDYLEHGLELKNRKQRRSLQAHCLSSGLGLPRTFGWRPPPYLARPPVRLRGLDRIRQKNSQ